MECCKNNLGSFPHNAAILTGVDTDEAGVHKLEFTGINGTKHIVTIDVQDPAGDPEIYIPKGILNEDMFYLFTIEKPSGDKIITDDCENYSLTIYIQTNSSCGDLCAEDDEA